MAGKWNQAKVDALVAQTKKNRTPVKQTKAYKDAMAAVDKAKASSKKALAKAKELGGNPWLNVGAVAGGAVAALALGYVPKKKDGTPMLSRNMRRIVRLGGGAALVWQGAKYHPALRWFGAGLLAAEAGATALEYFVNRGRTGAERVEIGAEPPPHAQIPEGMGYDYDAPPEAPNWGLGTPAGEGEGEGEGEVIDVDEDEIIIVD